MKEEIIKNHTFVLASFPRSGTNYFQKAWKQKTNRSIAVFRRVKEIQSLSKIPNLEIISTIKPPLPSLISRTMIYLHEDPRQPIENTVSQSIQDYQSIYSSIVSDSHHIIDVSRFDYLDAIIDLITKKENESISPEKIKIELDAIADYSRTFLDHEKYKEMSDVVLQHDLSACEELYTKAYLLSQYNDML